VEYPQAMYVQPDQPEDASGWWLTGACALAVVGAGVAVRSQNSSVAEVDEADLESATAAARIATLAVGGKKDEPWSLTGFLQKPRKSFFGDKNLDGELELLSGAARPGVLETLNKRFDIGYDTRSRKRTPGVKAKAKAKPVTTWRSKAKTSSLYPGGK